MRERLRWLLRGLPRLAILLTAVAELASGDILYGTFCVGALVLTLLPAIHARSLDAGIPIELEFALLWLIVTDMTLGNAIGLYRLVWYDKALHLSSSMLIATIGFLAIYVLHLTHRTRFHPWIDGLAILMVTLGVGALWEIAEFAADRLLDRRTQGAPNLPAIDDTMFDLIFDGIGGVLGSVLGPLYIRYSKRSKDLVQSFARLRGRRDRVQIADSSS